MKTQLGNLLEPIEAELANMRRVVADQLHSDRPAVQEMIDHIGRFQGKQLRGALVLLAAKAAGPGTADPDELARVAAVVELIHLATLVHDDVLDGADIRRRVASVNHRWDNQTAVLLGDLLYARAFQLSTWLPSRLASRVLSATTQRICAGEIEQARRRYDFELSQAEYESIASAKTGELYAAACELGASYPSEDTQPAPGSPGAELRAFGWELGLAFQIIDDVLDVVGTLEEVGKSVGNDVEDGKVTLPVLHVYSTADELTRTAIRDAYTRPDILNRTQALREVCDLEPGLDYARARADELLASAMGRLARLPDTPARQDLVRVGEFILARRW